MNFISFATELAQVLSQKISLSRTLGRSSYWTEEAEQFDYLFTAHPLVLNKLRHHCHLITGIRAYEYGKHHQGSPAHKNLISRLEALVSVDPSLPIMAERRELGGFGFEVGQSLYNIDTLKFHEMSLALKQFCAQRSDVSLNFDQPERSTGVILEIGGGWGGFAETLLRRFTHIRYAVVDLPEVLLVAGTLFRAWFPEKRIVLFDPQNSDLGPEEFDILLVCNSDYRNLPKKITFDIAVNAVSFQEMTSEQVRTYVEFSRKRGCRFLYSHNRDRSNYNKEISSVREILSEFGIIKEIQILDTGYSSALKKSTKKVVDSSKDRYRHVFLPLSR